ncbi:flavin-containing monooxygenase [Chitinophaga sp. GCM10012297]|uniref:NAD(P)-binding domain-containing protein n=1 Tax=Chitinophaga chungangae TaxID=2821488 RepID=A0ABS3YC39_9BACT|nr:NAD(P)-binding domain-containing protein [Chitinophaga chungangae]MBO9152231.1 NAD(P)-binding domain-containing protein [Chitinophaga chungangae]
MKHVGIIGAGLSGLATAKAFIREGFHVTVIEKAASVGGVWEKSRSYHGVATQTTRDEYAFSDFPMPSHYPLWPSGEQVQQYLEDYARHFGILSVIRFNTAVTGLRYENNNWEMDIYDAGEDYTDTLRFHFVAICTGTFHKPHIPAFKGMETFTGQVLHTSQVADASLLKNKSVAVVGFAKSATDIATLAADTAKECQLLFRKAQWKVPRYFGNLINMRYLLFSRFSEAFFNAPYKTGFQKFLHSAGKPMVWAQWRGLELLLKKQFNLKACGMVPQHRIEDQISCSLGVAPEGFYEKVRSGAIRARQTEISHFEGEKVFLQNGTVITPEVVVCGTGFTQSMPFLEEPYKSKIVGEDGGFRLFRNIVNPDVPQLGFVGFNSSLFTTLTSEIAANWLVKYAQGTLQLPAKETIQKDVDYMAQWRKTARPISSEFSGTCIAPFNFMHLDMLMKDMGLKTKATRWLPYEFFKPINPKDYRILLNASIRKAPQPMPVYQPAEIIQ